MNYLNLKHLVLALIASTFTLNTWANNLVCVQSGNGYLPYNTESQKYIGSGSLYQKGTCNKAIDAYNSTHDIVCSWQGKGWQIFNATTGITVHPSKSYWFDMTTCLGALSFVTYGVVCAPRGTGSGIYDLENDFYIGFGYYYEDADCFWASISATKTHVCAPESGYSAIFNRRYNETTSELILTAKQCHGLNKP